MPVSTRQTTAVAGQLRTANSIDGMIRQSSQVSPRYMRTTPDIHANPPHQLQPPQLRSTSRHSCHFRRRAVTQRDNCFLTVHPRHRLRNTMVIWRCDTGVLPVTRLTPLKRTVRSRRIYAARSRSVTSPPFPNDDISETSVFERGAAVPARTGCVT